MTTIRTSLLALAVVAGTAVAGMNVYKAAVDNADRLDGDSARDAGRQPAAVLEFVGIAPGMTVLDLFSGGGYYAELMASIVGEAGQVDAHSNKAYVAFVGDEFEMRYADNRLPNVSVIMAENNELVLEDGRYDAMFLSLTFHDFYYEDEANGWAKIDVEKLLGVLHAGLKPGGVIGIIDHYAEAGSPKETGGTLHRIDPAIVIAEMKAAGFELDGGSDLLRNPADDHQKNVFDPELRGQTDRFLLRFRKPG